MRGRQAALNGPTGAALVLATVSIVSGLVSPAAAQGGNPIVMKLSTATINDTQYEWMKRFAAAVEKDSGGRIKGEVYGASQLGSIPRQIEGAQFGSIQGWVGPPEFLVGARAVQGLGGAVVSVVALSLIMTMFTEPAERAKAMGFIGFVIAGAGVSACSSAAS